MCDLTGWCSVERMASRLIKPNTLYHMAVKGFLLSLFPSFSSLTGFYSSSSSHLLVSISISILSFFPLTLYLASHGHLILWLLYWSQLYPVLCYFKAINRPPVTNTIMEIIDLFLCISGPTQIIISFASQCSLTYFTFYYFWGVKSRKCHRIILIIHTQFPIASSCIYTLFILSDQIFRTQICYIYNQMNNRNKVISGLGSRWCNTSWESAIILSSNGKRCMEKNCINQYVRQVLTRWNTVKILKLP